MNRELIPKKWKEEKESVGNKGLWRILNLLIKISSICGKNAQISKNRPLNLKNQVPQRTKWILMEVQLILRQRSTLKKSYILIRIEILCLNLKKLFCVGLATAKEKPQVAKVANATHVKVKVSNVIHCFIKNKNAILARDLAVWWKSHVIRVKEQD